MSANANQVHRDASGAIIDQSITVKKTVAKLRMAIGWEEAVDNPLQKITVFGCDEDRGVLVVQIGHSHNYYRVSTDDSEEVCLFQIRKGRHPKFFLMDPRAVVQWAEAFIAGVRIENVGSLVWCGALLMVPVRAMPPEKSMRTINVRTGISSGVLNGLQKISVTGKLMQRLFYLEWYADGEVEIVQNSAEQKQSSVIISGKHKIIVCQRGDSPWVRRSVAHWDEEAA
jgi:hypothetical protein